MTHFLVSYCVFIMSTTVLYTQTRHWHLPISRLYNIHNKWIFPTKKTSKTFIPFKLNVRYGLKGNDANHTVIGHINFVSLNDSDNQELYNHHQLIEVLWEFGDRIIHSTQPASDYFNETALTHGIQSTFHDITKDYLLHINGSLKVTIQIIQKCTNFLIETAFFEEKWRNGHNMTNTKNKWIDYEQRLIASNPNKVQNDKVVKLHLIQIKDQLKQSVNFNNNPIISFEGFICSMNITDIQKYITLTDANNEYSVQCAFDLKDSDTNYIPIQHNNNQVIFKKGDYVQITATMKSCNYQNYIKGINIKLCHYSKLTKIKKYKICFKEKECKGRIHFTNNLDVLIYFYPQGKEGKSKPGYIASDIQFQILSKEYRHKNENIEIIWKCGNQIKTQNCSIRRYITPNTDKALGCNTLFSKTDVEKFKCIIAVTCTMSIVSDNEESKPNKPKINTFNKRQRQTHLYDFKPFKKLKTSKEETKEESFNNDWRLSRPKLMEAINLFSEKLSCPDLFPVMPTIDCFASNRNHQTICKNQYITAKEDFFSQKYDSIHFWKKHVSFNLFCFGNNIYHII